MAPWLQISEFSVNGPASPVLRHILDQRRQSRRPMPRRRLGPLQVDSHRQLLAELHAELIEGIYAPYGALHEHTVLVQRQQATQGSRRSLWVQQQRARPVAVVDPVNADPRDIRRIGAGLGAVRLDFLQRIAESERLQIGRDTSELQSPVHLVCRLLLEKKKKRENCAALAIIYRMIYYN